jgi:regulator of extracellular matrix RemA (YlzA/DUF370 family)
MINVGFGNAVNSDKVVAAVSPEAAPVKRLVAHAKAAGRIIDATQGRKTKAVLVLDGDSVMLSALQPDTVMRRFNQAFDRGDIAAWENEEMQDDE